MKRENKKQFVGLRLPASIFEPLQEKADKEEEGNISRTIRKILKSHLSNSWITFKDLKEK